MDSIDQTAKLIKQQADSIEAIVVEHIMTLYSERRRARKVYQEEQTWLNNQFQQVENKQQESSILKTNTYHFIYCMFIA